MADSSTQHHRIFQHILVRSLPHEKLWSLLETCRKLRAMWTAASQALLSLKHPRCSVKNWVWAKGLFCQRVFLGDSGHNASIRHPAIRTSSAFDRRIGRSAPIAPSALGSESLGDKFVVLMHVFTLEVGLDAEALGQYCSAFRVTTTDLGTEFGLNTVEKATLRQVFPW